MHWTQLGRSGVQWVQEHVQGRQVTKLLARQVKKHLEEKVRFFSEKVKANKQKAITLLRSQINPNCIQQWYKFCKKLKQVKRGKGHPVTEVYYEDNENNNKTFTPDQTRAESGRIGLNRFKTRNNNNTINIQDFENQWLHDEWEVPEGPTLRDLLQPDLE